MQKSEKGFALIEILILAAIILIIAAIAIPELIPYHSMFKDSFGIEKDRCQPSETERQVLQLVVTKRLGELRANVADIQKEKDDLLATSTANPREAMEKVSKLHDLNARLDTAERALWKAEMSAQHFRLKTDL